MSVQPMRRGLPRVAGGPGWPPGDDSVAPAIVPAPATPATSAAELVAAAAQATSRTAAVEVAPELIPVEATAPTVAVAESVAAPVAPTPILSNSLPGNMRAGLPRFAGGAPWPSGAAIAVAPAPAITPTTPVTPAAAAVSPSSDAVAEATPAAPAKPAPAANAAVTVAIEGVRRGLPRENGGAPWPPEGRVIAAPTASIPTSAEELAQPTVAAAESADPTTSQPATEKLAGAEPAPSDISPAATEKPRVPLKTRIAEMPLLSKIFLSAAILIVLAGVAILIARAIAGIPAVQSFMTDYPGVTELPDNAPVGLPVWLNWQHFFNVFFMVLIIRTGITIRREQRPGAYWASRRHPGHKISLTVWFHQSLDLLWVINGIVFIVLLFVTGQWMRIVPTSWEIFPNALTAGLKYASLNWPTENGWVNYNSLQVIAYFTTVFIAAPLAAITGIRTSNLWPEKAKRLNKIYPIEWARAIHFPVMIYFCIFIVIHVFLVFATGALRNLNHMYASSDAVNWTGLWFFAGSLVLIAAAWIFARPILIAPIARLFGSVTSR